MKVLVLGSAAGGGYPQWNCRCAQCERVRRGALSTRARTQSSIAVSMDSSRWLLVNASPDLRQQFSENPALWPRSGTRDSPVAGVLLTDAQLDHVTGLLMLREGCPMELYCTLSVYEELTESFPVLNVLEHWNGGFRHKALSESPSAEFRVPFLEGCRLEVVPLQSNAPPYSPRRNRPRPGDNIGLWFADELTGRSFFYAPGLGEIDNRIQAYLERSDVVMVDGTFWRNDEMSAVGLGGKQARDMGHLPLSGPGGMLEVLAPLSAKRKILAHINNTNPILDECAPERALLDERGIEVAYDGMEIDL